MLLADRLENFNFMRHWVFKKVLAKKRTITNYKHSSNSCQQILKAKPERIKLFPYDVIIFKNIYRNIKYLAFNKIEFTISDTHIKVILL